MGFLSSAVQIALASGTDLLSNWQEAQLLKDMLAMLIMVCVGADLGQKQKQRLALGGNRFDFLLPWTICKNNGRSAQLYHKPTIAGLQHAIDKVGSKLHFLENKFSLDKYFVCESCTHRCTGNCWTPHDRVASMFKYQPNNRILNVLQQTKT